MKSRIDSIIAAVIISLMVGAGLTGAYALNDTSGIPATGNGVGSPIAVEGTPEATPEIPEETAQPTIFVDELPSTGAGPTTYGIAIRNRF